MRLTQHTLSALAVVLTLAGASLALSNKSVPAEAPPDGSIHDSMEILQGGTRRLDKALEKGDLEAAIKTAVEMQAAVHAAKTQTPEKAGSISDAKEKAKFVLGFRKQLIALQKALLDVELAALDGKADDAKKIYNESVKPMKKEGHAKYKD